MSIIIIWILFDISLDEGHMGLTVWNNPSNNNHIDYNVIESLSYKLITDLGRILGHATKAKTDLSGIWLESVGRRHLTNSRGLGRISWHPARILAHWGRDKMAAILQTTISNAFSWMIMHEFRLRVHGSLFIRVQLWVSDRATSYYLDQWWLVCLCIYASLGLNELICVVAHIF